MSRQYLLLAFLGHSFIALGQSSSGGATDEGPLVVFANPNDPTLSVSPSQIPISSSNSADGGLAVLSIFSSALATFRTGGISASASSAPPNSEPPPLSPTSTSLEGGRSLSPVSPSSVGVQSTSSPSNPQSTVITSVPGGVVGGGVFTPASELPSNSIQTSLDSPSISTQSETTGISSSLTETSTISNSSTTTTQQDTTTTQSLPLSNSQPSTSITESSSIESTASSGTESSTTSGVPPASTTAAPVAATPGTGSSLSPLGASYSLFGVLLTFLIA